MKLFLVLFFFVPVVTFGQLYQTMKVGVINDPDGYTFVRNGPSLEAQVIDTVLINELFLYHPSDSLQWLKVSVGFRNGYMHKSRILNTRDLSQNEQKTLLTVVFEEEKRLYLSLIHI